MTEQGSTRRQEEYRVSGGQILRTVKKLLHEGNVRRISIKQDGRVVFDVPVNFVVVGILLAPLLTAIGAFAAVATHCTISVEREERTGDKAA